MKGYWVCTYEKINNEEKLKEYALKAKPAVEKHLGKFLVRGGQNRTTEGINSSANSEKSGCSIVEAKFTLKKISKEILVTNNMFLIILSIKLIR